MWREDEIKKKVGEGEEEKIKEEKKKEKKEKFLRARKLISNEVQAIRGAF